MFAGIIDFRVFLLAKANIGNSKILHSILYSQQKGSNVVAVRPILGVADKFDGCLANPKPHEVNALRKRCFTLYESQQRRCDSVRDEPLRLVSNF